jgi:hypothetical protein
MFDIYKEILMFFVFIFKIHSSHNSLGPQSVVPSDFVLSFLKALRGFWRRFPVGGFDGRT